VCGGGILDNGVFGVLSVISGVRTDLKFDHLFSVPQLFATSFLTSIASSSCLAPHLPLLSTVGCAVGAHAPSLARSNTPKTPHDHLVLPLLGCGAMFMLVGLSHSVSIFVISSGMTLYPFWSAQRKITCVGKMEWLAAMSRTTSSDTAFCSTFAKVSDLVHSQKSVP